jgi:valyl-tRNA synthetase
VVPFVTESLWQRLPGRAAGEFLIRATWPERSESAFAAAAGEFETIREAVLAVRQIRGDNNVAPSKTIDVVVLPKASDNGADTRALFEREAPTIARLTRADVRVADAPPSGAAAHAVLGGGTELVVPLAGLIDIAKECERLRGEVAELGKQIQSREGRLSNPKYVERAPANVVASDRAILEEMKTKREQLESKVRTLCGV